MAIRTKLPKSGNLNSMDSKELLDMVQIYQLEYRKLSAENQWLKSVRNAQPTWTRAEPELPGDDDYRFCGCFGIPKTYVLVYDHFNNTFDAQQIETLKGQSATYEKLPSRFCNRLFVYVEEQVSVKSDIIPTSKDRLRITGTGKRFVGFREFKTLNMKGLKRNIRIEILKGNIRWIFVLDHPKSASTEDQNAENEKLDSSRKLNPKTATWMTDCSQESTSTDSSGSTKPIFVAERSATIPEAE